jgi:tripartite-type tricarboxylate transporter receptor subunit TctC
MAPYLRKHIAGNPRIQVINVPGADGIIGLNKFALTQPPNGEYAAFGTGAGSLLYLLREPGVRYDLRKFVPVLALSGGNVFYISPDTGVRKPADLIRLKQPLLLAGAMPVGGDTLALVALKLLGVRVKTIMGYEGKGRTRVAFEQGESNFDHQSTIGYLANVVPLVESGKAVPLFTSGSMKGGQLVRDPVFPHLPTVGEAYQDMYGHKPAGPAWDAVKALVATVNSMQKVLWFHADAPQEAVEAVKAAAVKMAQDPQFLREGTKILGEYPLILGDDLDAQFNALLNTPNAVGDWVLQFLVDNYGVTPR